MSVAEAYVDLHVNGDHLDTEIRSSIKKSEKGAGKESDKVGNRLGSRLASGFLKGFSDIMGGAGGIGKSLSSAFSGFNPKSLKIPAIVGGLALAASAVSALAGALTAFVGAASLAASSSLSLVGVIGALVQAKIVGKIAFEDFSKAVAGDAKALAALSPAARSAAQAATGLTKSWDGVKKAVQQNVFVGLDSTIKEITKTTLPVLKTGLTGTGTVLNSLFKDLGQFATSEAFVTKFGTALASNNAIFDTLRQAAVPVLDGLLNVFNALSGSGGRLATKIVETATAFQTWSSAPDTAIRIQMFMDRAFIAAGNLWGIIKNLGATLRNVFGAATPAGEGLLLTLNDLTARLAAFTELTSTKNSIAKWAEDGIRVSGQLFSVLGRVFDAISPLFNPNLAGGFLTLFEKAMPLIGSVATAIQSYFMPIINRVGEAFAENGPKFAKLFTALAPLLKGVGSIIGEIVGQAIDMLGTVASLITPIVRVISGVVGPVLTKFAPIIAAVVLALGPAGLGKAFVYLGKILGPVGGAFIKIGERISEVGFFFVKAIPIIGKFLAPLVNLSSIITSKIGPAVLGLGKVVGAVFKFLPKLIGGGAGAASGFISRYFGAIFKTVSFVMKGVVGVIQFSMKIVTAVIKVAMKIVSAVFGPVLRGIFNLVKFYFTSIWKIIQFAMKIAATVIRGALNVIRTVFGPALSFIVNTVKVAFSLIVNSVKFYMQIVGTVIRFAFNVVKTIFVTSFNFIKTVVVGAFNIIRSIVVGGFNIIKSIFMTGFNFVKSIVTGVFNGIVSVIRTAWTFISGIVRTGINAIRAFLEPQLTFIRGIFDNVWNGIRSALDNAWNFIKSTVSAGINFVSSIITTGVNFVRAAFTNGFNALSGVVSSVFNTVRNAVSGGISGILNLITSMPGKIISLAGSFLNAGKDIGANVIEGIGKGFSAAGGFISDLMGKIRRAINNALNLPQVIGKAPLSFTIPAFANGVRNFGGGMALVGERGPELVTLPRGSNVYSNAESQRMAAPVSGSGAVSGETIILNQNYYGPSTSNGRMREIDQTLRYSTKARRARTEGLSTT